MGKNAGKICFVTCVNDERWYEECLLYLKHLRMPPGMEAATGCPADRGVGFWSGSELMAITCLMGSTSFSSIRAMRTFMRADTIIWMLVESAAPATHPSVKYTYGDTAPDASSSRDTP